MTVVKIDDLEGGVRLLTLSRPKANLFRVDLAEAISAAVAEATKDDAVRALVFRGEGMCFSGGLDFRALMEAQMAGPEERERFGDAVHRAFIDVWTCPKATVAAMTGHAIAAGWLVGAACDFRCVIEGPGKYGLNELEFGAGFPPIAIEIGRYVLQHRFAAHIQNGECYGWEEGVRNGTFHGSFKSEKELMDAAQAQAARVGAMPRAAYNHVKQQLIAPYMERVKAETPEHKARTAAIYQDPETMEAIMAYVAKVTGGGTG